MERLDQDFKKHHHPDSPVWDRRKHINTRRGWGVVLVLFAMVLFANVFNLLPYGVWDVIISWEMLLIVIGVLSLINNRSVVPGLILIALGLYFMGLHHWELPYYLKRAFWPAILLIFGLYLIISPPRYLRNWRKPGVGEDNRDFIDEVSVFSGGDRMITSQNFKGGRIVSVFGGSKINLMGAALAEGEHILDTLSVFGGSTIIVPAGWTVRVEVTSIFGGFSDKRERMPNLVYDQNRILLIKGLAIFGGGEVKSFGI